MINGKAMGGKLGLATNLGGNSFRACEAARSPLVQMSKGAAVVALLISWRLERPESDQLG